MTTKIHSGSGLLSGKIAVIYGGGGAIGGAAALAFAEEGARVFLAGRTLARLDEVAERVRAVGGEVEVDVVDALDQATVEAHAERVAGRAGRIDVVLNALGLAHVQGKSFAEQTLDEFATPVVGYTRAHFIIAKAASRFMIRQGGGVILALSTPGSVLPGPGFMGYGVACAALEAMTRHLAGELGAHGVRAVCLRADAIPERSRARTVARFSPRSRPGTGSRPRRCWLRTPSGTRCCGDCPRCSRSPKLRHSSLPSALARARA